jgi:hypothetical protein
MEFILTVLRLIVEPSCENRARSFVGVPTRQFFNEGKKIRNYLPGRLSDATRS